MGKAKVNDVFLSYAEEDGAMALRVYDDLERAKLRVWRYEKDSRIGTPIRQETREVIERSRFFCLLDSAPARQSFYIREECAVARDLMGRGDELLFFVCLIQPRKAHNSCEWWSVELFEDLNYLSYADLTDYDQGIQKLCDQLGSFYHPRFELPRDLDFQEEAYAAGICQHQIAELVGLYANFRQLYGERPSVAEAQLAVLIHRCERLNATGVVSPRIALGILQAESERHEDASATFLDLVRIRPEDPRAWAGLAGARFHLGDYGKALEAYQRCQSLLDRESPEHRSEMAHNLAMTLLALGRADEAWTELTALGEEPYVLAARGEVLLAQSHPKQALSLLERAFRAYRKSRILPLSLVLRLADCYQALGQDRRELAVLEEALGQPSLQRDPELLRRAAVCYFGRGRSGRALECLNAAVSLVPGSLVYRAERALLLRLIGDVAGSSREAHHCFSPEEESPRERYYRGLAFHLLGVETAAQAELRTSRRDPAIAKWPVYATLLRPAREP